MQMFGINFTEERPGKFYSEILDRNVLSTVKWFYEGKIEPGRAKSRTFQKESARTKSRFITATCFETAGELFIFYHFELNKKIYTLRIKLKGNKAESITSVYPTASWIEREMSELYGVKFVSKAGKSQKEKPLLLTPDVKTPFKISKK